MAYKRLEKVGFLGRQRDEVEAGTLKEEDAFVNIMVAADMLGTFREKVPVGFVKPVIKALQLAQLNAPSDQEEVEVMGEQFKCSDILSEKNDTNGHISGGYIRTSAVEKLRTLVKRLHECAERDAEKTGFVRLGTLYGITKVYKLLEENVAHAFLYEQDTLPRYPNISLREHFSMDQGGHICTNLGKKRIIELTCSRLLSDEWKSIPNAINTNGVTGLFISAFLNRKSGDTSIEVLGETIPLDKNNNLQMTFGRGTIAIVYKGNAIEQAIGNIQSKKMQKYYVTKKADAVLLGDESPPGAGRG